jgi:hypothetical protein
MDELRARSTDLFEGLAQGRTGAERATAGRERPFSWFNPDDAAEAVGLAAQLVIVTGAAPTEDVGLERALDLATTRAGELPPDLVAQAMAIFVTHHPPARQLAKPRTIRLQPELFTPSRRADAAGPQDAVDPERELDYWREDPFANEHHGHWHQVYPFPGVPLTPDPVHPPSPPASPPGPDTPAPEWIAWAGTSDRADLAALFHVLDPARDWPAFLASATASDIASTFLREVAPKIATHRRWQQFTQSLPVPGYRVLFRLNDRQGELFFYMHNQMLARYDAERLSNGRSRPTAAASCTVRTRNSRWSRNPRRPVRRRRRTAAPTPTTRTTAIAAGPMRCYCRAGIPAACRSGWPCSVPTAHATSCAPLPSAVR